MSKSVLAKALGIDEARVRRRILGPLGEEAAAASFGQFLLTRHRAIAEAAADIAVSRFNFDPEEILTELVRAAILADSESSLVPHLVDWRYLSTRMFDQGNHSLGVRLAATALAADPKNSFLAVKLAQLYREAGQAEQSVRVFRKSVNDSQNNRAFFTEWATGEGSIGNSAMSVWLGAVSLADGTEMRSPSVKDIAYGFTGALVSFLKLYERYQDRLYLLAAVASNQLGRILTIPISSIKILDKESERLTELGMDREVSPITALSHYVSGTKRAFERREVAPSASIPPPSKLEFDDLKQVLRIR